MLINLAAFVVVVAGIMSAKSLLVPFLLAIFLAIIFTPPYYWLRRKKVPPFISVALIVIGVVILQLALTSLIGSSLADFSRALPQYQQRLHLILQEGIEWVEKFGINITDDVIMDQLDPGKLMGIVGSMLNNLLAILKDTFIILLTFMFIMLEAAGIPAKIKAMAGGAQDSLDEYIKITQGVNRYLFLKTLTSLATGILAGASLHFIGVDFAIMWGFVAFVLNFIPTIGSIIAAVPAVLLALVQLGVGPALSTAGIYMMINVAIGNILEPRIMGAGVGLSTLVIFLSMAFWGWVLGPVGMLLSVPLTMTLKIGMQSNEKTKGFALMLGSNADAANVLASLSLEKNE
ncbi:MAG: AI-2E family transporter [Desulfobulbaceae bacterium]|nr:AI-2E family transporter [Desulfobulbaceae bacterium]